MERHLAPAALVRLFSGQTTGTEVETAVSHLAHCRQCLDLAARIVAELRRNGLLVRPPDGRSSVLDLLEVEERTARKRLLARSEWAELQNFSAEEQTEELEGAPELQTLEMFQTVMANASADARDDPFLGEERALVAHALAGRLLASCCSEATRNDLQSQAMLAVANCRRLSGEWRGSAAALKTARSHLEKGTGDPVCEARFLSIQASLASDTGHLKRAQACLSRASAIIRTTRDPAAVASITAKEASALLAAGRHEEAMERAGEALRWLTPRDARLEMLVRSLATECLAFLGRPAEALRSFLAAWPLYEQLGGRRAELEVGYLEALLLDVLNCAREAEKAYRYSIAAYMEAELYKDAFLTMLTLFESLVRRGAWDKAARACEEALERLEQAGTGCHYQTIELWRDLLTLVDARRLTDAQLLAARLFLVRHWSVPAQRALLLRGDEPSASIGGSVLLRPWPGTDESEPQPVPTHPAVPVGVLAVGGIEEAMERYERQLIAAGLARCDGCILETSRLLDVARNTLKAKIKKYGLAEGSSPTDTQEGRLVLPEAERQVLNRLRARSLWSELKKLPAAQQIERIKDVSSLQTREMFETVVSAASTGALEDPAQGEETALVAQALAETLPRSHCSEKLRHDLLSAALLVIANCRRLSGDWPASAAALAVSRSHLEKGTGDPLHEARLLSIQASLVSDTGQLEQAQALLASAAAIYRGAQDSAALASIMLKDASALLAGGRHEEAMARAEETLRGLSPREARLEMLARSLVTECLAHLGRPTEALRSLDSTWSLYEQFRGRRTELMSGYLVALVLDALGYIEEAEAAYRTCIAGYMKAKLYKDAFLTLLTRFESLFRRGAWDQAARACEEALAMEKRVEAGGHAQMTELWRDLLTLVNDQRLTADRVLEARHALVRHWSTPAPCDHSTSTGTSALLRWDANGTALRGAPSQPIAAAPSAPGEPFLTVEPPALPANLAGGGYRQALESYERQLIAACLARCGGRIKPACRLLGMSRNALRERIRKYGLSAVA